MPTLTNLNPFNWNQHTRTVDESATRIAQQAQGSLLSKNDLAAALKDEAIARDTTVDTLATEIFDAVNSSEVAAEFTELLKGIFTGQELQELDQLSEKGDVKRWRELDARTSSLMPFFCQLVNIKIEETLNNHPRTEQKPLTAPEMEAPTVREAITCDA